MKRILHCILSKRSPSDRHMINVRVHHAQREMAKLTDVEVERIIYESDNIYDLRSAISECNKRKEAA